MRSSVYEDKIGVVFRPEADVYALVRLRDLALQSLERSDCPTLSGHFSASCVETEIQFA